VRLTSAQIEEAVVRLIGGGPGAVSAVAIPTMGLITASVGMGLMPVTLIEGLAGRQGPGGAIEITLAQVVRQVFLDQAQAALLTLVGISAAIGVLILLLSGLSALVVQWFGLETDDGEVW
jgi:hypothetical protein